jgi:type IV pilus biogenesis protein CpaD/CtpE
MKFRIIFSLGVLGLLAGCATTTATQDDYGNSHRSLVSAQAANPATLTAPSTAIVTGTDSDYMNNVVVKFREAVSEPTEVSEPIEMVLMGLGGGY